MLVSSYSLSVNDPCFYPLLPITHSGDSRISRLGFWTAGLAAKRKLTLGITV